MDEGRINFLRRSSFVHRPLSRKCDMQNSTNTLARPPARITGALAVRALALTYLAVVLIIPLAVILYDGLRGGLGGMVNAILRPVAWHALMLSLWTAAVMAAI